MIETVGAVLIENGHVLLGLRAGYKSFPGCWDLIGGHVEAGEEPLPALCRELFEEVGVEGIHATHIATMTLAEPAFRPSILHVYSVSAWRGEPVIRNDEHVELRWFDLDAAQVLPNLVSPQYRNVFASLRQP